MFVITENLPEAFRDFLSDNSIDRYRARQALHWIYKKSVFEFSGFKNIPKPDIDFLKYNCRVLSGQLIKQVVSEKDNTLKFLIRLSDGCLIESALLHAQAGRLTACLSTQVGCPVCCKFCASGRLGFKRNLSISEIVSQYLLVQKEAIRKKNRGISNIVFMGIGEPLLNYDNLIASIEILMHPEAANISSRHITVSTCGIPPQIERLAGYKKQVRLSISLHSAIDRKRNELVPLNKKYNINLLIQAVKRYIARTGRFVTFEYVLIKGINDGCEDIVQLARVLKGIDCKVNVIPYNRIEGSGFKSPSHKDIKYFISTLIKNKVRATERLRKGCDINSGCGQLKASFCAGS